MLRSLLSLARLAFAANRCASADLAVRIPGARQNRFAEQAAAAAER